MENVILIVNVILAVLLVGIILLQKSEGGALGLGASQDSFISSRFKGMYLVSNIFIFGFICLIVF